MPHIKAFRFTSVTEWFFLDNHEVYAAATRVAELEKKNVRYENLEQHVPEFLRQWILNELINTYHYPPHLLSLTNETRKNANILIKDSTDKTVALIAARYFGTSVLNFEQACHQMQNALSANETARFGIVTDGVRITFLFKSIAQNSNVYQTIIDFPTFEELQEFDENEQASWLQTVNETFQKLPVLKKTNYLSVASAQTFNSAAQSNSRGLSGTQQNSYVSPPFESQSALKTGKVIFISLFSLVAVLIIASILAVAVPNFIRARNYANQIAANANSRANLITTINGETSNANTNASAVGSPDNQQIVSSSESSPSATIKSSSSKARNKTIARRRTNSSGSINLSSRDTAIMQTRPASNPNVQLTKPVQGSPQNNLPSNRIIIQQPYSRPR